MLPGETLTLPPAAGVTASIPLSIEALVALALVQLSVDDPPCVIAPGEADREPVGAAMTAMPAVRVIEPPGPVSVRV